MSALKLEDIPKHEGETTLANGLTLCVKVESDADAGPPWEECEGHGPVSEWTKRDKRAGEILLCSDGRSRRFYDFAEAVKIAKRDGWDAPPYKTGTKGEQAVRAVKNDFEFLREWCADLWQYVGVIVTLKDEDGREVGSESLFGVESRGDYWREVALEIANGLIAQHETETAERSHWEARDTVTKATP